MKGLHSTILDNNYILHFGLVCRRNKSFLMESDKNNISKTPIKWATLTGLYLALPLEGPVLR